MANRHFGKIGDIWKHLPLAEVLALEKPKYYWESHAGSALYDLSPSMEHDYGVYHFYQYAPESQILRESHYYALLAEMRKPEQPLHRYPGSPLIAMKGLTRKDEFVFCDLDPDSLEDIRTWGERLGYEAGSIRCMPQDGVRTTLASAAFVSHAFGEAGIKKCFAFLDPYDPFEGEISSLDAFGELNDSGFSCMLWYGFDGREGQRKCHDGFRQCLQAHDIQDPWCGEIVLTAIDDPDFPWNPGVMGCGIFLGNLSDRSYNACEAMGKALVQTYRDATFPDGGSGAFEFTIRPYLR